jgi:hypothetical protein
VVARENLPFKKAWHAVGNPRPGITTWSADVDSRPVFTAWRERDLKVDPATGQLRFHSPPGSWAQTGTGKSYMRRVIKAHREGWACRLILLEGKSPWNHVKTACLDDQFAFVRFNYVDESGLILGELLPTQ